MHKITVFIVFIYLENNIKVFFSHFLRVTGFQYYRCILLVPDIYNRQHIKEVVNMLLLNMGFSGIIIHI